MGAGEAQRVPPGVLPGVLGQGWRCGVRGDVPEVVLSGGVGLVTLLVLVRFTFLNLILLASLSRFICCSRLVRGEVVGGVEPG